MTYQEHSPTDTKIHIAFGNKARSGKDSAVNYIIMNWAFTQIVRFAEPIYTLAGNIQRMLGKPQAKDPVLLQQLGQSLKTVYGPNVWVDMARESILMHSDRIVVPDLRFKAEYNMLKEKGFITVRINRQNRTIDRPHDHPSEIDLDDQPFDHTITNDHSLNHLYACVRGVIMQHSKIAPYQLTFTFTDKNNIQHIYGGFGNTYSEAKKMIDDAYSDFITHE